MPEFQDTKGRTWDIALTYGSMERIGWELFSPDEAKGYYRLIEVLFDTQKFAPLLWLAVEKRAKELGVSRSDFFDDIDTAAHRKATEAFYDAVVCFSSQPAAQQKIYGTGAEIIRRIEESILGDGPGNSPAPSGSTPPT